MDSQPSEPPRKRRRPPKACEQCRKRKVRCDQSSPCNQCVRLHIADCWYDPQTLLKRAAAASKQSVTPKSATAGAGAPPTPASTTDNGLSSQSKDISHSSSVSSTIHSPAVTHSEDTVNAISLKPHHNPSELLESNGFLQVTQRHTRAPAFNQPTVDPHGTLHGTITKTRLLGNSHWINTIQEFPFVVYLKGLLQSPQGNTGADLLNQSKVLGRKIKNQILSELKALPNARDHVPAKDVADELVDNYFRAFESCYRILHIPSFRREYDQFWRTPDNASQIFIMKMLLVLAIGTCVTDEPRYSELHNYALQWIAAAQSWLSIPFTEKARLSVSGIQIYCLLLLARETCAAGPDLIWISAGALLRMAMLTGLYRDPAHFARLTPFQKEIRRRLWATVLELNLQACMNAGGSPMLSADMHDCQPPANLTDEDMDEESGSVAGPKKDTVFTGASLQIALVQTFSMRLIVAQLLNDFRNEQDYSETLKLDSKLGGMLNQIAAQLRSSRASSKLVQSDTDMRTYEIMANRFMLGLHYLFALKAMADPIFYYSRKVSLDTALSLLTSAFSATEDRKDKDHEMILEAASGTAKNTLLLSFTMISLELITQIEQSKQGASSHLVENALHAEIFRLLALYSEHMRHRIQKAETNVKGYVFSSIGYAYLKALAERRPAHEAGYEAATYTCQAAVEILQNRLTGYATPKVPVAEELFGEDPGLPFGDDFGWDDWDPTFNFMPTDYINLQA